MKKLLGFLCLLLVVIATSCQKKSPEQSVAPVPESLKKLSTTFGFTDFPTIDDGTLVFRDDAHYDSYMDFLSEAVTQGDPEDPNTDASSILQQIEGGIGFTSIRSETHAAFILQNETGWDTSEEIPDEHFLTNPILKSTLNPRLEVKIGHDLVHYISKDYAVRVDSRQASLVMNFRGMSPSTTISTILQVDPFRTYSSVYQLFGDGYVWVKEGPKPTGDWQIISSKFWTVLEPCNDPLRVQFGSMYFAQYLVQPEQGYFVFHYGDGQSSGQIPTVLSGFGGHGIAAHNHLYSSPGNYTVEIDAYLLNGTFKAQKFVTVSVGSGCKMVAKDSYWQEKTVTAYPNRKVKGRLYIEFYSGNNKMRMIAETSSWEYKNNKWKQKSGRIEVDAECAVRADNCDETGHLYAYQLKGDHNSLLEHRGAPKFKWSTASSKHYLTVHESVTMLQINLSSCP